jgi:probable F420-dependent oxidoreductase
VATHKPFRFGVVGGGSTVEAFAGCARTAESLGYSVFLSSDHLDLSGAHFSQLSAIPALAYAAAVTSDIRLGTSVINQDLHHPAVLAREAASLDVLCNGRLELGLGAGWAEYEYKWAGLVFDEGRTRVERFEEYVQVVKALLEPESVTYHGKHFQITDMPGVPGPVRKPRPRLMIGGTGKRMLTIAVREAEIVGINLNAVIHGTAEAMDERVHWVRDAAGPHWDDLEVNNIVGTLVVDDGDRRAVLTAELERQRTAGRGFMTAGLSEEEILESPVALIGSVEQLVEDIQRWRERWGISYVIVQYPMMEKFAPVVEQLRGH